MKATQYQLRARKTKANGVSLLECLFYLIIVSSIVIATVSYFKASTREQKLVNAVSLTRDLLEVAAQYWGSNLTFAGLTVQTAAESGLLPVDYVILPVEGEGQLTIATPWTELNPASSVTFSDATKGGLQINFNNIPNYACLPLKQHLIKIGYTVQAKCDQHLKSGTRFDSTVSVLAEKRA